MPMLPRDLSEDRMSLNPHQVRRSLIFDIELDGDSGEVVHTNYYWGKIKSVWKGTYRAAHEYYINPARSPHRSTSYTETLDLLKVVGLLRINLAAKRNVVNHIRNEAFIDNIKGKLVLVKREAYVSELYNEQISLLCNSEGANIINKLASENGDVVQPIFRIQVSPSTEMLNSLENMIKGIVNKYNEMIEGPSCKLESWKCREQSLASYLDGLTSMSVRPDCELITKNTIEAIHRQALMHSTGAHFSSKAVGHFSLKVPLYARFSSPMREIAGCFTHKELKEGLEG